MDIEIVIQKFLDEVQRLVDAYGNFDVEDAFRRLIGPDFDLVQPTSTFDFSYPSEEPDIDTLAEQLGLTRNPRAVKKVSSWVKGKVRPKASGPGVGTAGAAGAATASALGRGQEVSIADISTSDKMDVRIERGSAPWLETLIKQTNELIQQMVDLLSQSQPAISKGLSDVNMSIDDMIAVETGEDAQSVQSRQDLFQGTVGPKKQKTSEKESKHKEKK